MLLDGLVEPSSREHISWLYMVVISPAHAHTSGADVLFLDGS